MKRLAAILLLATFAAFSSSHAQRQTPPPANTSGEGATDDAVGSISTLKRPTTKPTTTTATPSGPKKGLQADLSKDEKGKEAATTFPASASKIYLHFTDDSATKGEKLTAVWIAENAVGISARNKKLTETTETLPGPGSVGSFDLPAPKGGFPVGKYRAELYEGGKLAKSLKFAVTK